MLRKQDADILIWMAAMLAFVMAYIWNPPGPKYFPIEGVWQWGDIEGSPGMSWYARFAYAVIASSVAGLGAWTTSKIIGHSEKTLSAKIIYALTLLLAVVYISALVYIVQHELTHLSLS